MMDGKQESHAGRLHARSAAWLAFAGVVLALAACSGNPEEAGARGDAGRAKAAAPPANAGSDFEVDVAVFARNSSIEPKFPQLWIYDRNGRLVSTELTYRLGVPLNIEVGRRGPVFDSEPELRRYLASSGVDFDRWRDCGAEYCVVQVSADSSLLEHCEGCDRMQSALDAYFARRETSVAYRRILLTDRIPLLQRLTDV